MSAYREESVVRASYTLEAEEIEREWAPTLRAYHHTIRLAVAGTAAICGAGFVFSLPRGVAQVAVVVCAALAAWQIHKSRPKNNASAAHGDHWEQQRRVEFEANESEVAFTTSGEEERAAWEVVLHWRETDQSFLIYTGPGAFRVVPKRVLASAEQATTLRQLLNDRVRVGGGKAVAAAARTAVVPVAAYQVGILLVLLSLVEACARLFTAW